MQQAAATAGVLAAAVRAAYTAPGGFAKLELGVVHAFAERLRAGGKLSLVIDYDLTVSAGGVTTPTFTKVLQPAKLAFGERADDLK